MKKLPEDTVYFYVSYNHPKKYEIGKAIIEPVYEALRKNGVAVAKLVTFDDASLRVYFHNSPFHCGVIFRDYFLSIPVVSHKVTEDDRNRPTFRHGIMVNNALMLGLEDFVHGTDVGKRYGIEMISDTYDQRRLLLHEAQKSILVDSTEESPPKSEPYKDFFSLARNVLEKRGGLIIGEDHSDIAPKKELIQFLEEQKNFPEDARIKTLYLEHLLADDHQALLDDYAMHPDSLMPYELFAYLSNLDQGNGIVKNYPYNFRGLVECAIKNEVRVVCIDTSLSYIRQDYQKYDPDEYIARRYFLMNYLAKKTIEYDASHHEGNFVVLNGFGHVGNREIKYDSENVIGTVAGLDYLLKIPSVSVREGDYDNSISSDWIDEYLGNWVYSCKTVKPSSLLMTEIDYDRNRRLIGQLNKSIDEGLGANELLDQLSPECKSEVDQFDCVMHGMMSNIMSYKTVESQALRLQTYGKVACVVLNNLHGRENKENAQHALDIFAEKYSRLSNSLVPALKIVIADLVTAFTTTSLGHDQVYDFCYDLLLARGRANLLTTIDLVLVGILNDTKPKLLSDFNYFSHPVLVEHHFGLLSEIKKEQPGVFAMQIMTCSMQLPLDKIDKKNIKPLAKRRSEFSDFLTRRRMKKRGSGSSDSPMEDYYCRLQTVDRLIDFILKITNYYWFVTDNSKLRNELKGFINRLEHCKSVLKHNYTADADKETFRKQERVVRQLSYDFYRTLISHLKLNDELVDEFQEALRHSSKDLKRLQVLFDDHYKKIATSLNEQPYLDSTSESEGPVFGFK